MKTKLNFELYVLKAKLSKTFTDPRRLIIIEELREGEKSVGDLVEAIGVPQAVVSRHLAILRERGVVRTRREGTSVFYSLTDPRICEACDIVQKILLQQIENNRQVARKLSK